MRMCNEKLKFLPTHGITLAFVDYFLVDIDLLQQIHIDPVVNNLKQSMYFTWCNISDFWIVHQSNKHE